MDPPPAMAGTSNNNRGRQSKKSAKKRRKSSSSSAKSGPVHPSVDVAREWTDSGEQAEEHRARERRYSIVSHITTTTMGAATSVPTVPHTTAEVSGWRSTSADEREDHLTGDLAESILSSDVARAKRPWE